ncbi:hypothetical protein [Acetobacter sp.]|uniref:hypothetical protein n=1 Tax=Acetobacter sp. TaxID=440 RepID=UPI0025BB4716|nr:hypothetical protein [Acetobacter sp.]MCH4091116.1 hypothetical protein [Acetobacter sp.]MCI1300299.1 hypothetical protein [Acetobacter sp.]MCI1316033.1 hypothetical protein [Acetobacter sp.]
MPGSRRFLLATLRRRHGPPARCRNSFRFSAHTRKRALARHNTADRQNRVSNARKIASARKILRRRKSFLGRCIWRNKQRRQRVRVGIAAREINARSRGVPGGSDSDGFITGPVIHTANNNTIADRTATDRRRVACIDRDNPAEIITRSNIYP